MFGVFVKLGMTALIDEKGRQGVTLLQMPESYVLKKKDYGTKSATVIAAGSNPKNQTKPLRMVYEKLGKTPMKKMKEFTTKNDLSVGDKLTVKSFNVGDYVDVKGVGKGKGFAGVIKRHNFRRQPASHGNTKTERKAGSTGQCADPGRVMKGKKMAGRMGGKNVAVQSLAIVRVYEDLNIVAVHGSVPGPKGRYVNITPAVRKYSN